MRKLALLVLPLAASPALAQLSVSAVRETQKIRPADAPPAPPQGSISLSCAQNEFCAFQLEVSAGAAAVTVSDVSLGDLAGPSGASLAGSSALVYREGFLNVGTPSNAAGAAGEWPDPLIPKVDDFFGETRNAFPAPVPAGTNQPFFVELHVPVGQAAGAYAGTAMVTAQDGSTASVAVAIQVRGFALPSTSSLPSAYGMGWDGPCLGHFGGYGPPNCDDAQLEALNALYVGDALNHRLTVSALVYAPPIADGGGDWTAFDNLYGPFLNGEVLTGADQLQGAAVTEIAFNADDHQPATYAAWAQHFQTHPGWWGKLFDYTCDEPPKGCAWSDITARAANAHAGDPGFRTLVTTSLSSATVAGVLASIDILVPIVDEMDDPSAGSQRASYDAFLAQPNAAVWMYQSCAPSSSCVSGREGGQTGWPTMFIDEPAITNRIMQWMDYQDQVQAELYYETTYAMEVQDAWQSQYEFGNNGDGSIFYPGKPSVIGGTRDIPIESFRMKMLREGMQDYEYLHLLDTLGDGAFARAQLATVVTAANAYTQDPGAIEAARLAMAAEIEKDLGTATGGSSTSSSGTGSTSGGGASAGSSSAAASSGGAAAAGGSGTGGTRGSSNTGGGTAGASSSSGGSAIGGARGSGGGRPAGSTGRGTNGGGATGGEPRAATGSCGCGSPAEGPLSLDALLLVAALAALRRRRGTRPPLNADTGRCRTIPEWSFCCERAARAP
ncbi:MAG: DUF4091 domain-containing protein [Myxococcales bacterium]